MKRVVIIGAGGRLGAALAREWKDDFDVVAFNHAQLDLGQPAQMRETLGPARSRRESQIRRTKLQGNPKFQSQKGARHVGLFWLLGFEICLGFGFWNLEFPG